MGKIGPRTDGKIVSETAQKLLSSK